MARKHPSPLRNTDPGSIGHEKKLSPVKEIALWSQRNSVTQILIAVRVKTHRVNKTPCGFQWNFSPDDLAQEKSTLKSELCILIRNSLGVKARGK
ncbi:hypothetical protein AVEN_58400-1 [Araneus ventricosus]|uniref:Uncharacterized protein n=1 Tax=Araneus ventricosus TaxID=182803 RepID=A0A4Y2F6D3_ARAVE|nr:hypothetical protein AVEN_58400-1 [Araneus ventricosus]